MSEYDKPLQSNTPEYEEAMTPRDGETSPRDSNARTASRRDTRNVVRDGSEDSPMNHTE